MRLFIGVYPSDEVIHAWKRFKQNAPHWPLRWTSDESLHLTLKFLGETTPTQEVKLNAVLEKLAGSIAGFSLELHGGGVFPPKGSPSIFWAGVRGDVSIVSELAHVLEIELKAVG